MQITPAVSGTTATFSSSVTTETLNVSSGTASFGSLTTARILDLSGGTLGGSGTLTVPAGGSATWSAGTMSGSGVTRISGASGADPAAALTLSGISAKSLTGLRTLDNDGNVVVSGTGDINSGDGVLIDNSGVFDFRSDADVFYNLGGTKTQFNNTGTLKKSSGSISSDINTAVNNIGTIEAASGTLNLNGVFDNFSSTTGGIGTLTGGTYVVRTNSTFKFTGADVDINAATIELDGLGSAIMDQNGANALGNLLDNNGSLTIRADRDLTTSTTLNNNGTVNLGANSVLTTTGDYVQAAGSTNLGETSSRLAASGAGALVRVQGGALKGVGSVDPVLNVSGGTVAPGLSPGTLRPSGATRRVPAPCSRSRSAGPLRAPATTSSTPPPPPPLAGRSTSRP